AERAGASLGASIPGGLDLSMTGWPDVRSAEGRSGGEGDPGGRGAHERGYGLGRCAGGGRGIVGAPVSESGGRSAGVGAGVVLMVLSWSSGAQLVWRRSWSSFRTRYSGTSIGLFWHLLHPLATILIYTLVFGYVMRVRG